MPDIKYHLLHFIRQYHKGKDKAITIRQIIDKLRLWDFKSTDPDIRLALRQLNLKGHPIVTCKSGVYWATEPADLDAYMANLSSRATKIFERMRAIDRVKAREFMGKQMEMFG